MQNKKLLLIDGHALAYRAYYAYPSNLTAPNGTPINVIFGFLTLLFKVIDQINPTHFAICLDEKGKTFRHDLFPEYKSNRDSPPEDLIIQLNLLREVLDSINFKYISKPRFEADDIIGTITSATKSEQIETFILSNDRDLYQLITPQTNMINNTKEKLQIITEEAVLEKTGVYPHQIIDLKALQGDASDFIPGVKGIGPKTASKLLNKYQSLENLYENINDIDKQSIKQKLIDDKQKAYLSQKLATIDCKVKIEINWDSLIWNPNTEKLITCFKKYNFQTLIKRYENPSTVTIKPDGHYQLIDSNEKLNSCIKSMQNGFVFDCETDGLIIQELTLLGIAISTKEKEAYYIPIHHQNHHHPDWLAQLKPLFEDPKIPKYAHNAKFDYQVLTTQNINTKNIAFDTMIAAFLLFPEERTGLKKLAQTHLNINMTTYDELTNNKTPLIQIPLKEICNYAAADADLTYRLKNKFSPLLKKENLEKLFYEIEIPLITVLANMELNGVNINKAYLKELENDFQKIRDKCEKEIYLSAETTFNIKSPKQLGEILFQKLNLPVQKKTKTGPSTASESLEKLKESHPIIKHIIIYRTYDKLLSTYVTALPELIHPQSTHIHTSFNQHIVLTGRLSSTHPNLQNIPIRTKDGQKIRAAFIPSNPENFILSLDYSQIELRCLAHLSQDKNLMGAFQRGDDIHNQTAQIIFNKSEITKEERYKAKSINFGIIYGISAFGLSQQLNCSSKEAKGLIDHYYQIFPTIQTFMNNCIKQGEENGYVTTLFGRKRYVQDINSNNKQRQQFARRIAVNSVLQGTAADIIKKAMINIDQKLQSHQTKLIIQVHDELVFDLDPSEFESIPELIKNEMESVIDFKVPLSVDLVIGKTWQENE